MSPPLSVIVANYNHARLLPRALDAILQQSRPADEVLVVDDASTDDSIAVIERYAHAHPTLRPIINPHNLGVLVSMNQAARQAKGDYLYFAAADDQVHPGFFARALALAARHPQAGIIFGMVEVRSETGRLLFTVGVPAWRQEQYVTPRRFRTEYLEREYASHSLTSATLYRREPFLALGGYHAELGHWGDSFVARALGLTHGASYLPAPVMSWRLASTNFSQRGGLHEELIIARRAAAAMKNAPDLYPASFVADWKKRFLAEKVERSIYSHGGFLERWFCKALKRVPGIGRPAYRGLIRKKTLHELRRLRRDAGVG